MKNIFQAAFLATGVLFGATSANAEVQVPGEVRSCYKEIYAQILSGNIGEENIRKYVVPKHVLENMRNPVTPTLERQVIVSTRSFLQFLIKKMNTEGENFSSTDVQFIKYKQWSHKILLEGEIGERYTFKLYLDPRSDCEVLNFIVAGVKGMLDGVPRK